MRENGHHNRETGKDQQETDGQGRGDDQSPKRHGERIHQHGLDGRLNGDWNVDCWRYDWVLDFDINCFGIDWAVEKHREGDDAHAQGQHGKDKTDRGAESDQLPALRRVEDSRDELREGLRRIGWPIWQRIAIGRWVRQFRSWSLARWMQSC